MKRRTLLLLSFAAISLTLVTAGAAAEKRDTPMESFEAKALWEAFTAKRSETEAALLEEEIIVTGVVADTGMSRYMTPCVYLAEKAGSPTLVICVLPRADAFKLSEFGKGELATMTGRVYRFGDNGVVLKQCKRYVLPAK